MINKKKMYLYFNMNWVFNVDNIIALSFLKNISIIFIIYYMYYILLYILLIFYYFI